MVARLEDDDDNKRCVTKATHTQMNVTVLPRQPRVVARKNYQYSVIVRKNPIWEVKQKRHACNGR